MTEAQAHSQFLDSLDRKTLEKINERISVLEPLVAEHRELCRRRKQLETRYGLNRTSELILNLLADYPEGLTPAQIAKMVEREGSTIRSTLSDLHASGKLIRPSPGTYGYAAH